jgi:hypothetical protein
MLNTGTFNMDEKPKKNKNVINGFFKNCKNKLKKIKNKTLDKKFETVRRLSDDYNKVASTSTNIPEIYFIEVFEDNSFKVVFNCNSSFLPVFIIEGNY